VLVNAPSKTTMRTGYRRRATIDGVYRDPTLGSLENEGRPARAMGRGRVACASIPRVRRARGTCSGNAWYGSRRRPETRIVAVGGVTRDVDAAIHDRRVHLLAKGLGWAKGNVERPRDTDRRERRGRRLGRWRGLGAAQAGNVGATASHSQNPVTVLHTDPTQLEQLSEHGHPLGIVKGPLQPGGMTG